MRVARIAVLWLLASIAFACAQTPLTTLGVGPGNLTTAAAYVGPGDVVSGAVAWWGLRAYSAATAGTKAANLCHLTPGVVCADINTLANGNFDVSTAVTGPLNCGVVTCWVSKLYDQSGANSCSGSPCDVNAGTAHPTLATNVIGSLPSMQSAADADNFTTASLTQAQPFTISFVYESTGTADSGILSSGGLQIRPNQSGAGTGTIYAGNTSFTVAMTNSAFHAGQVVFNGASSSINLDGSTSTGSPGTNGFSGAVILFSISGSQVLTGYISEVGIWSGSLTSGQQTSLNDNQHTYWGF